MQLSGPLLQKGLWAVGIHTGIKTHETSCNSCLSPEVPASLISLWLQLKWCPCVCVFQMSLMWRYLLRCPQTESALFEQGASTVKGTRMNAQSTFSFTHTERTRRFKSHWFTGPPRKAAVIMVEVNISLKCHRRQSADKTGLYLSYVKSLADYTSRSSFLLQILNVFTVISFSRSYKSSKQL